MEWETIYDHPDKVERKFIEADGYRTHYLASGSEDAKPLLLVHGGNFETGLGADRWFPTMVPLGRHFRVIAADQLGGGETDAPRDILDIGDVRVRANHMVAFIEALDIGPVHILGQSQGAWISAFIALTRPDLVDELILVDCASIALPAGGVDKAARLSETYFPGTMVRKSIEMTREGMREWMSSFQYDATIMPDAYLDRCAELGRKWYPIWDEPWKKYWSDGGERNRQQYLVDGVHIGELVPTLTQKPLLMWGRNSVKGVDNGLALYKRIPDAQFHVFDKADHFLWSDQWRDFNSLTTWFLTRND